jgi:flagellar basal-body rod modification protein FlgD
MTTPPVSSAAALTADSPTKQNTTLGKDAFLGLLVAQMQNQNPLQPQADGEFLAQLAQFSSLEQLQEIRQDMASLVQLFSGVLVQSSTPTEGGN